MLVSDLQSIPTTNEPSLSEQFIDSFFKDRFSLKVIHSRIQSMSFELLTGVGCETNDVWLQPLNSFRYLLLAQVLSYSDSRLAAAFLRHVVVHQDHGVRALEHFESLPHKFYCFRSVNCGIYLVRLLLQHTFGGSHGEIIVVNDQYSCMRGRCGRRILLRRLNFSREYYIIIITISCRLFFLNTSLMWVFWECSF